MCVCVSELDMQNPVCVPDPFASENEYKESWWVRQHQANFLL